MGAFLLPKQRGAYAPEPVQTVRPTGGGDAVPRGAGPDEGVSMIDGIPLPLVELTPWGLLALGFLLLMTGRLVPRSTVKDIESQRDHWQTTAGTSAATVAVQADTIKVFTESAEMQKKIMEALQQNAQAT